MSLLAEALPPAHERLVCSIDDGPFADVVRQAGIEVVILGRKTRFDPATVGRLTRLIYRYRPDVVHGWGWMSVIASVPACKVLGIPLVDGTIRSGGVLHHRSSAYWWTARLADEVIANSRSGLAAHPVPRKKGRVIHNGLDSGRVCCPASGLAPAGGAFRVVMAARMAPEKDFDTFVAAARQLHVEGRCTGRWTLVAVGDGTNRERLVAENADLVQAGVLEFARPGLDVMGVLGTAHAAVLLTDSRLAVEGCSNSILEYMACGLPVICSRGGGNREVIADGKTGFLIPPQDPQSLVERLSYLESHRAEAARMGAEGRRRVERLFSVENLAAQTLESYREAISKTHRGRAQ